MFTDEQIIAAQQERYEKAMHAVQSGIAWAMSHPDREVSKLVETKHMRTGVDSAHISIDAVSTILLNKGIITMAEYMTALADAAVREQKRWENKATQVMGIKMEFA